MRRRAVRRARARRRSAALTASGGRWASATRTCYPRRAGPGKSPTRCPFDNEGGSASAVASRPERGSSTPGAAVAGVDAVVTALVLAASRRAVSDSRLDRTRSTATRNVSACGEERDPTGVTGRPSFGVATSTSALSLVARAPLGRRPDRALALRPERASPSPLAHDSFFWVEAIVRSSLISRLPRTDRRALGISPLGALAGTPCRLIDGRYSVWSEVRRLTDDEARTGL